MGKLWCLVIEHNMKPLGSLFQVEYDDNDSVAVLKEKAKAKMEPELNDFAANSFTVWQCKDRNVDFSTDDDEIVKSQVQQVLYENVKKLLPRKKLRELELSEEDTLIVEMPERPATALLATESQVWCLLIDQQKQIIGKLFKVRAEEDIVDLRKKVKEEKANACEDIDADCLTVWQCKEPSLSTSDEDRLDEFLRNIDLHDERRATKVTSRSRLKDLELDNREVMLVQLPDEETDTLSPLPEFTRYMNMVLTKGKIPSYGAKSTGYQRVQLNPPETIYDGRAPLNAVQSTVAPPIHLFHPIFDYFETHMNDPNLQLRNSDLIDVKKFMQTTSILFSSEKEFSSAVDPLLEILLDHQFIKGKNTEDRVSADNVIEIESGLLLVEEAKLAIGEGGCDPSTQVCISMRRHWIDRSRESMREKCCCPGFLLAVAGPWLCVLGGVVTDKPIIQRLTDFKWTALSSTQEESRVMDMARIFVALRESLKELENFYKNLAIVNGPRLSPYIPHARFFPYPTSYTGNDGSVVNFRYMMALESDPTCVTFLAQVTNEKAEDIVIKFVTYYGWKVHEHLARRGRAPKLRYIGPLSGASDLRDNKGQASDECRSGLRMVVMDFIKMHDTSPSNALQQIEEILIDLHSEGYVFGDLRKPNILFDRKGNAFLIDFNWCGRYNTRMLEGIPEVPKKQIEQRLASIQDVERDIEEYVKYPLSLSEVPGMWVDGVKPLKEILPKHDWAMKNKLVF